MTNKLDRQDVRQAAMTNLMFHHCAQNYERMMGMAFCHALSKSLEKLYPNKEDYTQALVRHMNYYNTEPTLGAIIPGIVLGLEEGKANGDDISEEVILGAKTALMGPLAGIGDSLVGATYMSIVASISIGLSEGGSLLGILFFLIFHAAIPAFAKYYLFIKGYDLGLKAIEILNSKVKDIATTMLGIVGLITVGGIAANSVKVPLALEYTSGELVVKVGDLFDKIMPGLLPLCLTIGIWRLYDKKGWSPVKALLTLMVVVVIFVYLKIM